MTPPAPEVSVVIPCLNEAGNVPLYEERLFRALDAAPFSSEVMFSDGCSTDGTPKLLRLAASRRPGVSVIAAEKATSFAGSIRSAVQRCRGEYTAFLEADLSFSPADIARLLAAAKAGSYDCVCGSPFLGRFEGLGFRRRFLTLSANTLLRLRFGRRITSYTQIFKLFRTRVLRSLDIEQEGFMADAELTAKCLARGFSVAEVPVTMRPRSAGSSKLRPAAEISACLRLMATGVR
jgi:dolichol-phosphate mannosyltransferase